MTVALGAETVQDLVRDALSARTPLRITGRSHWMDAGRPVGATRIASLAAHSGVVDYVPGDLTITVRSGTTLREIAGVTAREGQCLPVDPFGSEDGTIGATVATGSFGPLAHGFGGIRDLVLGVEFVTGDGKVVRGGGRVVKNVAGFDLVRLITGSWGTLGIITEVTLRLYSLPPRPVTLALSALEGGARLADRIASVLSAPATPYTAELLDAASASFVGLRASPAILVDFGGNPAAVETQRDALARLGGAEEVPPHVWSRLRNIDGDGTLVVRISALPASVARVWTDARKALEGIHGIRMHASVGLGIVRCIIPADAGTAALERLAAGVPQSTMIFERLMPAMWPALSPGVVGDSLSRGIRKAFDPADMLNPGILGD